MNQNNPYHRVGILALSTNPSSMKSPVALQSTRASVLTSSKVSMVLRCTRIWIEFGPFSREQMTSLEASRFSQLGWHAGEGFGLGTGCASSSFSALSTILGTLYIGRTEKRLLLHNGGARLTRCGAQNPRWELLPQALIGLHLTRRVGLPRALTVHPQSCGGHQTTACSPLPSDLVCCSTDNCH